MNEQPASQDSSQAQQSQAGFSTSPNGTPLSKSAMAITGFVLGVVALITSIMPIINNISAFLALLGLVFAIVGLVGIIRGKRTGKVLAIVGIIVNVIAFILVLASQSFYSAALDEVSNEISTGATVENTSSNTSDSSAQQSSNTNDSQSSSNDQAASEDLAVGTSITLSNGLVVTINSVETGLINYNGDSITGVNVTYQNNGSEGESFNTYDWKGQDAQGAQNYPTYYSEATNDLSSGTLAAGGSVSGNIYFEGDIVKVLYYSNMISSSPTASWAIA